jgi:hypothetical protein
MRAYLAILHDSLREALVSKAMWAMLSLISILLIVSACFGYREKISTLFDPGDIIDPNLLAFRILNEEGPEFDHVRSLIAEDDLEQLEDVASTGQQGKNMGGRRALFDALQHVNIVLNKLVTEEQLYDKKVWTDLPSDAELSELMAIKDGSLKSADLERRNRLLIETALREQLRFRPQKRVAVTFATMEITPESLPLTKERLEVLVKTFFIPPILSFVIGFVGILFAIAITSPIVPRMYDQGALHLLLSKPVSRSLVFVTKFFGGCAFILLYISLLLGGLFLTLGVRFGIWNFGLIWCIPIFVFSFSIFYSVSALAGAIWKNAIVSLAMTAVFWLACTTVGGTYGVMKSFVDLSRIVRLTAADDEDFFGLRESGQITVWDQGTGSWLDFGGGRGGNQLWLGPIEDKKNERILAGSATMPPFTSIRPRFQLISTSAENGWAREELYTLSSDAIGLFLLPSGVPVVVTTAGVFAIGDPIRTAVDSEGENESSDDSPVEVTGDEVTGDEVTGDEVTGDEQPKSEEKKGGIMAMIRDRFRSADDPLQPLGPEERLLLTAPAQAAMSPAGDIYLLDATRLVVLTQGEEGQFTVRRDVAFSLPKSDKKDEAEPTSIMFIRATNKHVLIGTSDGDVLLYDVAKLQLKEKFHALKWNDEFRFVFTSPCSEQFYLLNHENTVQVVDAEEKKFFEPNWPQQGEISAFHPLAGGKGAIISTGDRLTIFDIESHEIEREHTPEAPPWVKVFRSVVTPIHSVFPQPGDLDQTVLYLTSEKTSISTAAADMMGSARTTIDPWDPIRANLIFIVIMLAISCVYIERQEL